MAVFLILSSNVIAGHVGGAAARFPLQTLGHEVWHIPTCTLTHHPGHGPPAGSGVEAGAIEAHVAALEKRGWLERVDAILTGYFTAPDQVAVAESAAEAVRRANPKALIVCDPIMGDGDTGAYVPGTVSEALIARLVPLADVVTPNLFELSEIAGRRLERPAEALDAAERLSRPQVLVTSIPSARSTLLTALVTPHGRQAVATPLLPGAPKGTGDLLTALFAGWQMRGVSPALSMERAAASVHDIIAASKHHPAGELMLAGNGRLMTDPETAVENVAL